jgi:hypothetical protein
VQHEVGSLHRLVDGLASGQVDSRAARDDAYLVAAFAKHANRMLAQHACATGDHGHTHRIRPSSRISFPLAAL